MNKLKTLIIDSDVSSRNFLRSNLNEIDNLNVVSVTDGKFGILNKIKTLNIDLIILDISLKDIDSLSIISKIKQEFDKIKIIVTGDKGEVSSAEVDEILNQGAIAFVVKIKNEVLFREDILNSLKQKTHSSLSRKKRLRSRSKLNIKKVDIIAIASSTGGPDALDKIFSPIEKSFSVPVVITQHMPEMFSVKLAQRLNNKTAFNVKVVEEGEKLLPGYIYFAGNKKHFTIKKVNGQLIARNIKGEPVNHCLPSADPMFISLSKIKPSIPVLALVLTGLGDDGARGALAIRENKGTVLIQDEKSSVIWGMAGETYKLGAHNDIVTLSDVGTVMELFSDRSS